MGWYRRYGLRFDGSVQGAKERTGFKSRRQADNWARENGCKTWIVFDYEPAVDMRLPGFTAAARNSYRG